MTKVEQNIIKARYLVETLGLENAASGLIVSQGTLKRFIETGEIKSTKILRGLNEFFCETILDEISKRNAPVNYDDADLKDLKAGTRKGGAGGGSNNSFRPAISEVYL